ncbi:yippee zinc-binding/DNA-binding /Mis18, centromere assembly-domain-containing protein [Delphinella strobiligena]|nr:yippee zinc-binding/DNA-binding /Mis18, centromere assembly-domain-containing protein [Delphinella strobiligena]
MRFAFPAPATLFPTYLTPSLPFKRRKTSTDSNSSASTTQSVESNPTQTFLAGHASHLKCARCLADLAHSNQIISKGFTGRHGRAYLVAPPSSLSPLAHTTTRNDRLPNLPNTYTHKPVARNLVTGTHTVSDISCSQCGSVLGWKYVAAEEESQRYKVGKFILETRRVCRSNCWEADDDDDDGGGDGGDNGTAFEGGGGQAQGNDDGAIEFDSQDEDECEDLFLGVWTPQTAARRREMKAFDRGND